MSEHPDTRIASPCVRNCCLDDDDVCLGCYRRIEEITGWASMDDAARGACLARCEQRRAAAAENRRDRPACPGPKHP